MRIDQWLSCIVVVALLSPTLRAAEQPAGSSEPKVELRVVALDGEGAVQFLGKPAGPVVVEVRDDSEMPVQNARVVFQFPGSGPGGSVSNGQTRFETITNRQGQASTPPLQINNHPGKYQVHVTASRKDSVASLVVHQRVATNEEKGVKEKHGVNWTWVAIAAGAATAIGLAVLFGTGSSDPEPRLPSDTTIIIQPGTVSVGGPK